MENVVPKTCCGLDLSWKEGNGVDYKWKAADCPSCLSKYVQNLGSGQLYMKVIGDHFFRHTGCGEAVKLKPARHLVRERTVEINYGEMVFEYIPYCPKHEPEPESDENPVFYGPLAIEDGAITLDDPSIFDEKGRKLELENRFILKNSFTELIPMEDLLDLIE